MDDAIMQMCAGLAEEGFFENTDWYGFGNTLGQIAAAYSLIWDAKQENQNEPVFLLGYSYGGAAAMELARMLGTENFAMREIPVDFLVTIEPVNFGRRYFRSMSWATSEIPDNVSKALNLWAGTPAEYEYLPKERSGLGRDISAPYLNGQEDVKGALNVEIAGRVSEVTTHFSIIYPETAEDKEYNQRTYDTIRTFISGRLYISR